MSREKTTHSDEELNLGFFTIDFGLIFPVILAVILSAISFASLRYVIQAKDDAVMNHSPDLISVQRLELSAKTINETSLGYLFTRRVSRRQKLWEQTQSEEQRFLNLIVSLRSLLTLPAGTAFVDRAQHDSLDYFFHLNHLIQQSRLGVSLGRISARYDDDVNPRYSRLVRNLQALTRFKERQLRGAIDSASRVSLKATRLILLSGILSILLGAALSWMFLRNILRIRRAEVSLRETLQIRDEFLSVASHELKNPLAALVMQIELLRKMMEAEGRTGALASEERSLLARSIQQIRRISDLVNELLDLTRLRIGKLTLSRSQVDLESVVREVVQNQAGEAEMRGSRIEIEAPEPVIGYWDPMRISQVAYNLVSNAIKYGKGKPILIRLENHRDRGTASFIVQDQGMGIPREMQEKVFRRFERGVSDQKIRGLGLGLYITRQIVTSHGGKISLQSAPGKGSTFTVELPYSGSETASPASQETGAAA